MTYEEQLILSFLGGSPEAFFGRREIARKAVKRALYEQNQHWADAPLASLVKDLEESSRGSGVPAPAYLEQMRDRFEDLLPSGRNDSPAARHLNSVLVALSSLEKNRGRATRSIS